MSDALKPTCDQKTRFWKAQKNTFGLLPGLEGTCPDCTCGPGGCWYQMPGRKIHTCYVDNLMRARPNVKASLAHNTQLLMSASLLKQRELLCTEFSRFQNTEDRHAAKTGSYPARLFYRIHWSGDFFNKTYAHAMREAVRQYPQITFWCYTRSFSTVPIFSGLSNFILYLSLDVVNAQHGLTVYNDFVEDPNIRLCYMSSDDNFQQQLVTAKTILDGRNSLAEMLGAPLQYASWTEDIKMRGCPVDLGKLTLEGGCAACGMCVNDAQKPVWFKS